LVHIPEVSRTDSAGNNPWALNSMLLIPKGYIISSSSSSNSIEICNMLKPRFQLSGAVFDLSVMRVSVLLCCVCGYAIIFTESKVQFYCCC
jgi:hypothetical protein